jgi:hypothetical protein
MAARGGRATGSPRVTARPWRPIVEDMARTTGIRAWLIEWDWDGDHARHDGPRYIVVNWRRSAKYVADLMERLYAQSEYSLDEQVALAAGRWENPYRARIEDFERIHCGHNPFLFARPVRNLSAEQDGNGEEVLRWEDLPIKQEWLDALARIRAENRAAGSR